MSRTYISQILRRQVSERARRCCEYCLLHEDDATISHEVDHIVAEKHGGLTILDNLAYACFLCNSNKGSDLASLSLTGELARFFNPRTDIWSQHFRIVGELIVPTTAIGEATERIFQFNTPERCEERWGLQVLNRFPTG
ncbi:HNH endonuclease [Armatimonas rosea]|uniref:HNH endonuclease n=1 Tax=Armatimonas rosea TaxID=685828 RepID=UPI00161521F3